MIAMIINLLQLGAVLLDRGRHKLCRTSCIGLKIIHLIRGVHGSKLRVTLWNIGMGIVAFHVYNYCSEVIFSDILFVRPFEQNMMRL